MTPLKFAFDKMHLTRIFPGIQLIPAEGNDERRPLLVNRDSRAFGHSDGAEVTSLEISAVV